MQALVIRCKRQRLVQVAVGAFGVTHDQRGRRKII